MQLDPRPVYFLDMSAIELVWNLVVRDPRRAATKDELWMRIRAIWSSLPQASIQKLFDSMPRSIAALIAAHVRFTKYQFQKLFFCFENFVIYLYQYKGDSQNVGS